MGGGEMASAHVGHVTLSETQRGKPLPRFPSQTQNFLFLLVLFVC